MLMRRVFCLLPVLASSALVPLIHAATLYPAYWAESSTDASGNYNYNLPLATGSIGGPLSGSIPTDASSGSPGNDLVNYFRTDTDLAGTAYDGSLLGNLSGATSLTATFSINDSALDPGAPFDASDIIGSNAGIRLMFMGGYLGDGTPNEWWSNPTAAYVTSMNNGQSVTLTVAFDPSLWSNYYGHVGNSGAEYTTEFGDALTGVTRLGLSFGSGDFFSNGFGVDTGGNASIQLDSIGTTSSTPEPSTFGILAGALAAMAALRRKATRS